MSDRQTQTSLDAVGMSKTRNFGHIPRHLITLSVSTSIVGGIVSPNAPAVLRLTTNSNLVGNWIGIADGFWPLRIWST